jgi:hypothetical protein
MKLLYVIIVGGLVVLFVYYFMALYNQTPVTKNIAASADLTTRQLPPTHDVITIIPNNTQLLDVGFNATSKTPIASYIRFNLSSIQHSDPLSLSPIVLSLYY